MSKRSILRCAVLLWAVMATGCSKETLTTFASDGLVEVRYIAGRIGRVTFESGNSKHMGDKELLQIRLWIENKSDATKLQYKGWGGDSLATSHRAVLTDDLGNEYKPVSFGILHKPIGQRANESIYPGTSIEDVLVFEVPVEKAQLMRLTLPRRNYTADFEGARALELEIPTKSFHNGV